MNSALEVKRVLHLKYDNENNDFHPIYSHTQGSHKYSISLRKLIISIVSLLCEVEIVQ